MPLQHRGSLHAHILIWTSAEDAERVKSEISATLCKYKTEEASSGVRYVPDVDLCGSKDLRDMSPAERLYMLVREKQTHVCRIGENGCKHGKAEGERCRYGFPCAPNREGTIFDQATQR